MHGSGSLLPRRTIPRQIGTGYAIYPAYSSSILRLFRLSDTPLSSLFLFNRNVVICLHPFAGTLQSAYLQRSIVRYHFMDRRICSEIAKGRSVAHVHYCESNTGVKASPCLCLPAGRAILLPFSILHQLFIYLFIAFLRNSTLFRKTE